LLEVIDVCKRYGERVVAEQLSLALAPGEILALLGPSGCGKSTLLKMIAGLVDADSGRLLFDGCDLAAQPPEERHFALMFQDYALFPHLNVIDNVLFGLRARHVARAEAQRRARAALCSLELESYAMRAVSSLSGGEAQRVALARALVTEPRLLLLDEPFSSLDAFLRRGLLTEFRDRLKQLGISAIWVTHDRHEAFSMADRVALLHQGRLQQCATPAQLLARPANPWVARFIGFENVSQDALVPDAAFVLGADQPPGMIEAVTLLAEGVALQVRVDQVSYALHLSCREARRLGAHLSPGSVIGVGIDPSALISF